MMRHIILPAFLTMVSSVLWAKTPSQAVLASFQQKFPAATEVKWSRENANEWEANFEVGAIHESANFSTDGQWLETEIEIPVAELPEKVVAAIRQAHLDATITHCDKINSAKSGILYKADLRQCLKRKEVVYTETGVPVK